MEKILAPICLFTYNRLEETKQTVEALQNNFLAKQSELFVFSDGPKNKDSIQDVDLIRAYIKTISGFKKITVFESSENKGLAGSVIHGVTKIINEHGRVIVLEDDLVTTRNFLDFMNQALMRFSNDETIYSISGFVPLINNEDKLDYFLHERSYPWGWATWKEKWNQVTFDKNKILSIIEKDKFVLNAFESKCGKDAPRMLINSIKGLNNSWYIRWVFSNFINKKNSVFPTNSLVSNVGFNSVSSSHCDGLSAYEFKLDYGINRTFEFTRFEKNTDNYFLKYYTKEHKILFRLRLLFKKNGYKLLIKELKIKYFNRWFQ